MLTCEPEAAGLQYQAGALPGRRAGVQAQFERHHQECATGQGISDIEADIRALDATVSVIADEGVIWPMHSLGEKRGGEPEAA